MSVMRRWKWKMNSFVLNYSLLVSLPFNLRQRAEQKYYFCILPHQIAPPSTPWCQMSDYSFCTRWDSFILHPTQTHMQFNPVFSWGCGRSRWIFHRTFKSYWVLFLKVARQKILVVKVLFLQSPVLTLYCITNGSAGSDTHKLWLQSHVCKGVCSCCPKNHYPPLQKPSKIRSRGLFLKILQNVAALSSTNIDFGHY